MCCMVGIGDAVLAPTHFQYTSACMRNTASKHSGLVMLFFSYLQLFSHLVLCFCDACSGRCWGFGSSHCGISETNISLHGCLVPEGQRQLRQVHAIFRSCCLQRHCARRPGQDQPLVFLHGVIVAINSVS